MKLKKKKKKRRHLLARETSSLVFWIKIINLFENSFLEVNALVTSKKYVKSDELDGWYW